MHAIRATGDGNVNKAFATRHNWPNTEARCRQYQTLRKLDLDQAPQGFESQEIREERAEPAVHANFLRQTEQRQAPSDLFPRDERSFKR